MPLRTRVRPPTHRSHINTRTRAHVQYDTDREGYWDLEDLRLLLRDLQMAIFSRPEIPPEERERALRDFDADRQAVQMEFER